MSLLDSLRRLLAEEDGKVDPGENPEPVAESNDEAAPDAELENPNVIDEGPVEAPDDAPADPSADDAPADPTADETVKVAPTIPEPVSPLTDEQRDDMNRVAAENESLRRQVAELRDIIASLGGDASIGIVEQVEEPVEYPDAGAAPEYDADADLAEQEAELARIRGE